MKLPCTLASWNGSGSVPVFFVVIKLKIVCFLLIRSVEFADD